MTTLALNCVEAVFVEPLFFVLLLFNSCKISLTLQTSLLGPLLCEAYANMI